MEIELTGLHFTWAVLLGALSAVSLPLGSCLGLWVRPPARITGALTAFGGGALIAALAVELVAPTAAEATAGGGAAHGGTVILVALLVGSLAGGFLFVILDQLVNERGGFLRKTATTIAFLAQDRARRHAALLRQLSGVSLLRALSPELVHVVVDHVRPLTLKEGERLFAEGDPGDALYFVVSGELELAREGAPLASLQAGDTVGEIAVLTGARRTATAAARGDTTVLLLHKAHVDHLRRASREFDAAATELAGRRLEDLARRQAERAREEEAWAEKAAAALQGRTELPTAGDLRRAREEHGGAPLAIWLGILLDGLPESFVIGATFLAVLATRAAAGELAGLSFWHAVPYTLIAGLFLSNFPEAMSSSIGMRHQGFGRARVFWLWFSLMVITGLGAGVGYLLGGSVSHIFEVAIEGLAAGAMLTMIASAMVPEAVHLAGPTWTGLSTLSGFLAAVAFKLLE